MGNKLRAILYLVGVVVCLLLFILLARSGEIYSGVGPATPAPYLYLPAIAEPLPPEPTQIPPDDKANELAIAALINQQRADHGLTAYTLVPELTQSSRRHSRDMADNNFTGHTGSDGSTAGQRMSEAGYQWAAAGENIGWGFAGNPNSMVNWWMNSPPHRAAILSTTFVDFGVGYARNSSSDWGHYWTVNFGRRATGSPDANEAAEICLFTVSGELGGSSLLTYLSERCP